jgi:GT2 family glycosyltransferase
MKISVIIPTRNRHAKLARTLECLMDQDLAATDYEIIIVDDGSEPPVRLPPRTTAPAVKLIRLNGVERSAARNAGAEAATGQILLFLDDDLRIGRNFITAHLDAHSRWPEVLAVGNTRLPQDALKTPFGRFRQKLERNGMPEDEGPVPMRNFCTAANMSISKGLFRELGGFDASMTGAEDQDLALRHTARGRTIIFIPGADSIHDDSALDIRSYCRRSEQGMRSMVAFCRRHPAWPDNIERERINGPIRLCREPLGISLRKLIKRVMAISPALRFLFAAAQLVERLAPESRLLDSTYRLLLGIHILRGYRDGLKDDSSIALRAR